MNHESPRAEKPVKIRTAKQFRLIGPLATGLTGLCLNAMAAPAAPIAAHSHFTETGFVLSVEKEAVERLLGPEQELTPQSFTDSRHNPVLIRHIQYPDMTGVSPVIAPFSYDEFLVYIPNVQLKSGYACGGQVPGPAAYMPVLFLDQQLPVTLGVQYYGFNKILAKMTASDRGFGIATMDGGPLYDSWFGKEEPLNQQGISGFSRIAGLIPPALMGRIKNSDGSSSMIWSGLSLDLTQAQYYTLPVDAVDRAQLVDGLSSLVGQHFHRPGVNFDYLGGYRIRGAYLELTQPVVCQETAS